jgi:hypothetical protein
MPTAQLIGELGDVPVYSAPICPRIWGYERYSHWHEDTYEVPGGNTSSRSATGERAQKNPAAIAR